jgi:hypothetical protein
MEYKLYELVLQMTLLHKSLAVSIRLRKFPDLKLECLSHYLRNTEQRIGETTTNL